MIQIKDLKPVAADKFARPSMHAEFTEHEFLAWYWLKEELVILCKRYGLSASGSKPDLSERISAYLGRRFVKVSGSAKRLKRIIPMPTEFTPDSVIGQGWTCNPNLGEFMRLNCGAGFRFNAAVRAFIHDGEGFTLTQAIECYRASVAKGATRQAIIPQNEYNRHTREFFESNPKATRQDAINAWWAKRNARK
jgi:hypothetical protein